MECKQKKGRNGIFWSWKQIVNMTGGKKGKKRKKKVKRGKKPSGERKILKSFPIVH